MNFRITLTYLQNITIGLLFLINLSCEIQAEKVEPGIYKNFNKSTPKSFGCSSFGIE